MSANLKIRRKASEGILDIWSDPDGEIFIRESLNRGRDVQTVCLTANELDKIVKWRISLHHEDESKKKNEVTK
jgi:hypothetical protein